MINIFDNKIYETGHTKVWENNTHRIDIDANRKYIIYERGRCCGNTNANHDWLKEITSQSFDYAEFIPSKNVFFVRNEQNGGYVRQNGTFIINMEIDLTEYEPLHSSITDTGLVFAQKKSPVEFISKKVYIKDSCGRICEFSDGYFEGIDDKQSFELLKQGKKITHEPCSDYRVITNGFQLLYDTKIIEINNQGQIVSVENRYKEESFDDVYLDYWDYQYKKRR